MDVTVTPLCSKGRRLRGTQKNGRTVRGELYVLAEDDAEFKDSCKAVLVRDGEQDMVLHGVHLVPDVGRNGSILLRGHEFLLGQLADRHAVVQEWRVENIELGEVMKAAKRCWELEAQLKAIHEERGGSATPATTPDSAKQ